MSVRLAAVSVDLDEIGCYAAIHGLSPPAEHPIYDRAVPRFEALFADEGIPGTFFAIGTDLDREDNRRTLRRLRDAGHEIGNHSFSHLYDLTRRDVATQRDEVERAQDRIEQATGTIPRGFRSPGYTTNDGLLDVLRDVGLAWDSSVFPCPAYYGAKVTAIAAIRARGRRSKSIPDDPRVLAAPADPYRVGRPYWSSGGGMLELPIGVSRGPRLPYIGTSVAMAGTRGARWLTRSITGRPLVNLELHGIDLSDAALDGLEWLRPHQPDLRRRVGVKEAALRAAIGQLRHSGYRFVTLSQAAEAFA